MARQLLGKYDFARLKASLCSRALAAEAISPVAQGAERPVGANRDPERPSKLS
jgi:hypothetical protein